MMAITKPEQWPTAMALYIISYISYGVSIFINSAQVFVLTLHGNRLH